MTPEQLSARIDKLERAQNLEAIQALLDVLIQNTPDVDTARIDRTISLSGDAEDITVIEFPDRWVELRLNGEIYRLPAYLKRLDGNR